MSLIDKQMYLKNLEERLGAFVPANSVARILQEASEALVDYEMTGTPNGEDDNSKNLLQYFLEAKRIEGRADTTVARYKYLLERLQADTGVPLSKITIYHVRSYFMSERERGISQATIEGYRSVYNEFYKWVNQEGFLKENPMRSMSAIKQQKVKRKHFSPTEIRQLEESAKTLRDLTIVHFLHATGCRISEVVQLNRDEIDFQDMSMIVFGKGAKERTVYINEVTAMYLKRYMKERKDDNPALFIGLRGERLTQHGVQEMLRTLGIRAGVENVHPHRFRRTLATELLQKGMPVQEVASILGHEKLETTMRYCNVDQKTVQNAYRRLA